MNLWQRLFGKKESQQQDKRIAGEFLGRPVYDLRDDKVRQIEKDAYAGKRLGADVDRIVAELIQIGKTDGYQSTTPGGKFNENGKHIRTRQIGERLNELGGMELMQAAYYRVRAALGGSEASSLENAWHRIGQWEA